MPNLLLIGVVDGTQRFIPDQKVYSQIRLRDSCPGHLFHLFSQISEWRWQRGNHQTSLIPFPNVPCWNTRVCGQQYTYAPMGHASVEDSSSIKSLSFLSLLSFLPISQVILQLLNPFNTNYSRSLEPLPFTP